MTRSETHLIDLPSAVVEVRSTGEGDLVVLLPDLGRFPRDFDHLSGELIANGCFAAVLNRAGTGRSTLNGENWTFHDLAGGVGEFIEKRDTGPIHVCGHAFGNRVARCLTADRPELVKTITLSATGGKLVNQHPCLPSRVCWIRLLPQEMDAI
ncbi:MAG: alpha/beta hydrolase [Chloroflexi bacterium]|nr:alpha/beta hydrolase [Chloroflexota bacterium]